MSFDLFTQVQVWLWSKKSGFSVELKIRCVTQNAVASISLAPLSLSVVLYQDDIEAKVSQMGSQINAISALPDWLESDFTYCFDWLILLYCFDWLRPLSSSHHFETGISYLCKTISCKTIVDYIIFKTVTFTNLILKVLHHNTLKYYWYFDKVHPGYDNAKDFVIACHSGCVNKGTIFIFWVIYDTISYPVRSGPSLLLSSRSLSLKEPLKRLLECIMIQVSVRRAGQSYGRLTDL